MIYIIVYLDPIALALSTVFHSGCPWTLQCSCRLVYRTPVDPSCHGGGHSVQSENNGHNRSGSRLYIPHSIYVYVCIVRYFAYEHNLILLVPDLWTYSFHIQTLHKIYIYMAYQELNNRPIVEVGRLSHQSLVQRGGTIHGAVNALWGVLLLQGVEHRFGEWIHPRFSHRRGLGAEDLWLLAVYGKPFRLLMLRVGRTPVVFSLPIWVQLLFWFHFIKSVINIKSS